MSRITAAGLRRVSKPKTEGGLTLIRTHGDKAQLRGSIVIHAVKAWPAGVRWGSLLEEEDVAWADKRTAEGELRRLLKAGILTFEENGQGRIVRATEVAAKAVFYALGKEPRPT